MNSTKEAAMPNDERNNLIRSLVEQGELEPNAVSTFEYGLNLGYSAGYESAREKWTAINSVEDLPKEDCPIYLSNKSRQVEVLYFYVNSPDYFLECGEAWMLRELPEPYQQGGE